MEHVNFFPEWFDFDTTIQDPDRDQPDYVNSDEEAIRKFTDMCRQRHVHPELVLKTWEKGVRTGINDTRKYDRRRGMHLMVESPDGLFESVMMDIER